MEQQIGRGLARIREDQKGLQRVMRGLYRELYRSLRESSGELPMWMWIKKEGGGSAIIIDPGDPTRPAIALKSDGSMVYTQDHLSCNPRPFDPPLEGHTYIDVAAKTFTHLRRAMKEEGEV